MKLMDIYTVERNENFKVLYKDVYEGLKKYRNDNGYFNRNELFDEVSASNGYARTTYTGKIKDNIDLTELELSMVLDNGYSHFGGSSVIFKDKTFSVTIYTD